jgi:hypothetical protein
VWPADYLLFLVLRFYLDFNFFKKEVFMNPVVDTLSWVYFPTALGVVPI